MCFRVFRVVVVVVIGTFNRAGLVGSFASTHGGNADRVAKITMARPKRKKVKMGLLPGPVLLRVRRFFLFVA